MDTITITGITANGTHGVLDFEHERAQTFVVDATLGLDLARAGRTDALGDTVDYGAIAKGVVAIIEGEHVDLIERLAARIADMILSFPAVRRATVTVHKPHAPITVPFADVAVTITRERMGSEGPVGAGHGKTASGNADIADITAIGDTGSASGTTFDAAPAHVSDSKPTVHHAIVALGGNIGDVTATLRDAVRAIDALEGTQITGISPLYRTAAWGMADGAPDFLNAVVEANTTLSARELLAALNCIEAEHGRTREDHWANRTLDLDIVDFDGVQDEEPGLSLPHPRAWQRAFVLVPWAALDPDADLPGLHGGPVRQLADGLMEESDGDEPPVELVARDWMSGDSSAYGSAADMADSRSTADVSNPTSETDGNIETIDDTAPGTDVNPGADALHSRRAVISMDSTSTDAERLFRAAIVALDGIPGNQVEGISPLYHIGNFDGPDGMAAVIQLTCRMSARELIVALGAIEETHGKALDLDLVDMEGVTCDEPDCRVPWPTASKHAAVLAPWLDMDPDARLGGDPVSYLLAMAPDAARVGMLSDDWILGPVD